MTNICPHPWRRFFARALDHSIYAVFATLFFAVVLGRNANYAHSWLSRYIFTAFCYISGAFIEGILLHFFATTPGKLLFGIKLTYTDGSKLSITDGVKRALGVWLHVFGLSLPFITFIASFRSYKLCKSGKPLPYENYFVVYHTEFSNSALLVIVFLLISTLTTKAADILPDHLINLPNKGEMTRDEFMENYEYVTGFFYNNNMWMQRDSGGQFKTDRYNSRVQVYSENDNVLRVSASTHAWLNDLQMLAIAFSGGSPSEIHAFMQSDLYALFGDERGRIIVRLPLDADPSYYYEDFSFSGCQTRYGGAYSWDNYEYFLEMERIIK